MRIEAAAAIGIVVPKEWRGKVRKSDVGFVAVN